MKKTTLRQAALKLALLASVLLAPLGLSAQQSLPYSYGFEDNDLSTDGWSTQNPSGRNASEFGIHTSAAQTGSYGFRFSSYNDNGTSTQYLISPELDAPSGVVVQFSYKKSSSSGTETFKVGYSTTDSDISSFTFGSVISASYSWTLSDEFNFPAGTKYIAIYYYPDYQYRLYIDNITFVAPPSCPKPTGLTANLTLGNGSIATLSWTPVGTETAWVLQYGTDENFGDGTYLEENVSGSPSKNLTGLTAETPYYARVKADCGGDGESDWCSTPISFTPTDAYTITLNEGSNTNSYIPLYGDYNDYGNRTQFIIPASDLESLQWASLKTLTFYPNAATYNLGTAEYDIYMKEVGYTTFESASLEDWNSMNLVYSGTINISDNKMVINFTTPYTYSGGNLMIGFHETVFPSQYPSTSWKGVSQTSGTYTAAYNTANGAHAWSASVNRVNFLPQVKIDYIPGVAPSCLPPTGLAATPSTTSAELSWTANSSETAWTLYWKKTTDENYTEVANATNPYTLNGLTAATNYQYYVVANCAADDASDPSTVFPFATECAVIPALGYSENFDTYTAGDNVLPICWRYINTTTNSTYAAYPRVYANSSYSTYANSAPNCLYFYSYYSSWNNYDPQPQYAILPEMDNLDGKQITLFAKGYNASSTLKVGRMTDPTDTSTFVPCQELTLTTSYQEFEVELTGTGNYIALMIDAATSSRTTNSVYVDDITVENVPTCRKPSALMLDNPSARTAHTATLKWTNGAEGQNAWQIAYSTTSDFNPDEVTPVDVTSNPATLVDLAQSTTYYAYVRANCGDEDGVSAWCSTKYTFSTLAGNVTPTGLAVAANTITSTEATASWNAVAGNTLHESYDIYWAVSTTEAPVTAVPAEPTAPNLISGITATSLQLTDLTPETPYKVWVRDNCGTDGPSAWSTTPVTFSTASACQTPDGLAASNVTNNSANISWNTYGQTSFKLQYRVNGAEWDDNNIITNVNTPYILSLPLGNTTYQVRVQATCTTDDSWSTVASFTTACDPENFPWSENFDTWDSKSVCWSFRSGQYNMGAGPATATTSSSAWPLNTSYGSYITIDGKALAMNIYNNNRYWAVTPDINITTDDAVLKVDVAVAAWSSATPTYDDNDTLAFAISTDGGATFTNLRVLDGDDLNDLGNDYTTIYVPVAGYNGQSVRFAIYGGSISGNSPYDNRCVIDNVSVEESPACYPVGTLAAATNVGATSAELSWTLVDDNQNAWVVEYATDEEFSDMQTENADNNEGFLLSGLHPETHYWVRVKADCGNDGDGEVSNVIDFTTDIACAAPTDLALDGRTTSSLKISWTENGDATSWTVKYMAEGEEEFHSNPNVTEIPYEIENLEDGVNYTVKVAANCANGYPSPEISAEFQTEASCPAPTNLEVTDGSVTAYGATITWEGNNDNDSYTIEYAEGPLVGITTLLEENFDGSGMPTGWSIMGLGTSNWSVSTTDNAGGVANEMHLYYNPNFNGISRLVTPAIDLTGITEVTFSFKHNFDNYSGSHTLGIATSNDGGITWNDGWSQSYSDNTSATISQTIATPDMGNSNVIFCIYYNGNSYNIDDWYFDDVTITAEYNPTYSWNELDANATSPYTINTLDPETQYVVRVKGVCGSTPSPASNIVGFTTLVACSVPENFAVDQSSVTHNSVELSWTAAGGTDTWVVAYKADGDADFTEVNNVTDNDPYLLEGLIPETHYTVKVKSDCGSEGPSQWSEEMSFTTLEACAAPTAFTLGTVTAHEATFSWTAGNGNTAWQVYVKKHADAEYPATANATVTAATATINELDAATVYDVKIVPDCDDAKLLEVANAFTTECETTVVDADNSFFEGFEGTTFPPICWSVGDPSNNRNWQRSTQYSNTGSASAYSNYYGPIYLYTPILHIDGTTATLSFSSFNRFVDDYVKNSVLVSVNGGDWTELWSPESVSQSWVVTTIDMTNYVGQNIQLCFKYEGNNAHGWYIDDVNLYVPTVIEKPIEANKWYAISSPVHNSGNDETLEGVNNLTSGTYDLYGYTESAGTWNAPTILEQGKGYIYRRSANATLQFVGIANTGNVDVNLTASCSDNDLKGFNLVGNPYMHDITVNDLHYTLNTNGTWQAHTSGTIGVAEAFLVQTSEGRSIDFPDDQLPANDNTANSALAFTVSNGEYSDVAYAMLDNGEGLPKIGHLAANAPMLSIPVEGRRYAIANLGSDCQSFNLVFRGVNGTYTIKQSSNQAIAYCHLIDRVAGKDIDMLRQNYTFSSNGFDPDRFMVKLSPDAQENANGNFAYWNGNSWMVEGNGTLQVFDALGRQLFSQEISNSNFEIQNSLFPAAGVYVLRMGEKTQKIVVR